MFKAIVGHSEDPDTQEAAKDIIDQCNKELAGITPIAGLLFSAIDFEHQVLLNALLDEWPDLQLIGCTTDGEVSSKIGFAEDSSVLMLFCSDRVDINIGLGRDLSKATARSTGEAIRAARDKSQKQPALCIALPDGLTSSGQAIVEGLVSELGTSVPLVGGTAGDQLLFESTYQFYGREILNDSIPVMMFSGPLDVSVALGLGCSAIGGEGVVTRSDGALLQEIDSEPAQKFYQKSLGLDTSLSVEIPLAILNEQGEIDYLRTPSADFDAATGEVQMFADTRVGSKVKMVMLDRDDLVNSCADAANSARQQLTKSKKLDAILHFSCAGRKVLLGSRTEEEQQSISSAIDAEVPSAGFYTYGEISPSANSEEGAKFHNHTSVIALLGEIDE